MRVIDRHREEDRVEESPQAVPERSLKRYSARVILFYCSFFLLLSSGRIDSIDPKAQLQAALLLVHTGRLVTEESPMPMWPNLWVPDGKGQYFQAHDLGGVVFMLPAAWLGSKVTKQPAASQIKEPPWVSRFGVALSYTLFAAAGCWFLFRLFALLYPPRAAFLLSLAFATTTIFWAYTKSAYDVLGACVGVCMLLRYCAGALRADGARAGDAVKIGLSFVVACSFRYSLAPFLLVGVLGVLYRLQRKMGWRPALYCLGAIGVVILPSMLYNLVRTGSPIRTGATGLSSPFAALQGSMAAGSYGLLLSPNRGLFVFAPVFLLLLLLPFAWRTLAPAVRQLVVYFGVGALAYTLTIAKMDLWFAIGGWGPRYLVPILPILFLGVAAILVRYWQSHRRPLVTLICVSALLNGALMLVNRQPGFLSWSAGAGSAMPFRQQMATWDGLLLGLRGQPLPALPEVQADPISQSGPQFSRPLGGSPDGIFPAGAAWRRRHWRCCVR